MHRLNCHHRWWAGPISVRGPRCRGSAGSVVITSLIQIIYSSQPFGYNESTLAGILLDARRCNTRDEITGALVCRHDIYLQLLEGPEDKVRATLARIGRDDRHCGIEELVCAPITQRRFAKWAMLHDPAISWIWSEAEIAQGALDRATPPEIDRIFDKLASQVETPAAY
jgi:hypothetical protein